MNYVNEWIYHSEKFYGEDIKGYEGFVYLIENLVSGRKYIGKKSFWSRRKQKSTGRKKTIESDWKRYYGSNDELKADVKKLGVENFRREILVICKFKKAMSFHEEREQWNRDVLLNDDYYNTNIGGKYFVTESKKYYFVTHREIVSKNDKWKEVRSKNMVGDLNVAKRPDVREKLSKAKSGSNHHFYGVTGEDNPRYGMKHSDVTKDKLSGKNHYTFKGKYVTPWGTFDSVSDASTHPDATIGYYAIRNACLNSDTIINSRNKLYTDSNNGKTFREIGFYLES